MLPPMNMPQMTGPPTPEMLEKLHPIKFAVLGVWCAAIGRLCTGDLPLGDFMCGISGVFLFKDDPSFIACYRCLMSTCFGQFAGQGGGGMACVMPFLIISIMNSLFMTFRLFSGGPFLVLSFISQLAGGTMAYQLNTLITATVGDGATYQSQPLNQPFSSMFNPQPGGGPGGGMGGGGGGFGGGGGGMAGRPGGGGAMGGTGGHGMGGAPMEIGGRPAGGNGGGGPPGGASGAGGRPFVPFAGSGQRLGDD